MFEYFCFIIGLGILLISAVFAFRKRYNTKEWISIITLGVLVSVFFMVLPTPWSDSDKSLFGPFYEVISALQFSLKTLTGRQDLKQFNFLEGANAAEHIYVLINYAVFFIIPILGTSLIMSFIGDSLPKIRYALPIFGNVAVFSELNENSYLIAKGLYDSKKNTKIVFCSTKRVNEGLIEKARKLHAINLYKKCEEIRVKFISGRYEFYLVSDSEDKNTDTARKLIEKHTGIRLKKINIISFVRSGPQTDLLESIVKDVQDSKKKKENINLIFIDKTELFCNNIVYENPLHDMVDKNKNISVMIIGCGETGMCMLKTVLWSGQIYGHKLKVKVYDKNADKCRAVFEKRCPELDPEHGYDVEFISTDVETSDFERVITDKGQAKDATVAYIFTGDDDFNIEAATTLHGIFRKNRGFGVTPPIFTWMNGSEKFSSFSSQKDTLKKERNIILTGNIESIYSEKILFRTELEKLALGVHLCYNNALESKEYEDAYQSALQDFINNDYNRRSSMAVAIHFETKLDIFDKWMKENDPDYSSEKKRESFEERLLEERKLREEEKPRKEENKPKKIFDILAENEHERWNAFMRSEGYRSADIETMKLFFGSTKKDRDDYSKLHLCITDWDNLDSAQADYNNFVEKEDKKEDEKKDKKKNFKKYDYLICEKLYEIKDFAAGEQMGRIELCIRRILWKLKESKSRRNSSD